ncbi:GntR family transcriptional regulator [Cryptosporangium minutisporangium]|uniref:GntR family transcriptional regulator n=1 Tax=Cryptosporangium minutisporangium TaxID=113569 RepID=A0ABP6SSX2_9ACTN
MSARGAADLPDLDDPGGLARPTSAQQVAARIRRMIFDQRLRAGDRVPQDEIAAELRVSRVPVREAVIALDSEGWVTLRPHLGVFVNGLDEYSVRDHYELVGLVYGMVARRVSERGSEDGMSTLEDIHRRLQSAVDPDEFSELNVTFVRHLIRMTRSRRINAVFRVMTTAIVPGPFFGHFPDLIDTHKRGIQTVFDAVRAGDGAGAERAFVDLLRVETESVVALLASRGLLTDPVG